MAVDDGGSSSGTILQFLKSCCGFGRDGFAPFQTLLEPDHIVRGCCSLFAISFGINDATKFHYFSFIRGKGKQDHDR